MDRQSQGKDSRLLIRAAAYARMAALLLPLLSFDAHSQSQNSAGTAWDQVQAGLGQVSSRSEALDAGAHTAAWIMNNIVRRDVRDGQDFDARYLTDELNYCGKASRDAQAVSESEVYRGLISLLETGRELTGLAVASALRGLRYPWGRCLSFTTRARLSELLYEQYTLQVDRGGEDPAVFDQALMKGAYKYLDAVYRDRPCGTTAADNVHELLRHVAGDFPRSTYAVKALFQRALIDQERHLCNSEPLKIAGAAEIEQAPENCGDAVPCILSRVSALGDEAITAGTRCETLSGPVPACYPALKSFRNDIRYLLWLNATIGVPGYKFYRRYVEDIENQAGWDEIWVESFLREKFAGSGVTYKPADATIKANVNAAQLARYAQCLAQSETDNSPADFENRLRQFERRDYEVVLFSFSGNKPSDTVLSAVKDWTEDNKASLVSACNSPDSAVAANGQYPERTAQDACVAAQLNSTDNVCANIDVKLRHPGAGAKGRLYIGGSWTQAEATAVLRAVSDAGISRAYVDIAPRIQ